MFRDFRFLLLLIKNVLTLLDQIIIGVKDGSQYSIYISYVLNKKKYMKKRCNNPLNKRNKKQLINNKIKYNRALIKSKRTKNLDG